MNKLPVWFKQEIPDEACERQFALLEKLKINTVCQEALCPNVASCARESCVTFMILGNRCTRNCSFCAVEKAQGSVFIKSDDQEPLRIAEAVRKMNISYAVVTSVTRDDLEDGGSIVFCRTVEAIRSLSLGVRVELLIPDFQGRIRSITQVVHSKPDVIAHNLETVQRLSLSLRPKSSYARSLRVLMEIKNINSDTFTKSSLMLGLGERSQEVEAAMQDLCAAKCDILTLGQYLAPSLQAYPVHEYIRPEQFLQYEILGRKMGFKAVISGPKVRSSYKAKEVFEELYA